MLATVKMSNVYHLYQQETNIFHMTFAQLADSLIYYVLLYIYGYNSFILMQLLLVSLNTNNAIINIGLRLLIKCILIIMLSYRLIVMYYNQIF